MSRINIEHLKAQGVQFLEQPPAGWHKLKGASTAPNGWEWWGYGSRFSGNYEHALVKTSE